MSYKTVQLKSFPRVAEHETPEARYWKRFKFPVYEKKDSPVSCIDFNPSAPHHYAVTAGTRIYVYDFKSNKVRKTISRFKQAAYSGRFRSDGKLLVAGGAEGLVQVFEMDSREILRQMKGHTAPVRYANWAASKREIFSCSDDKSAALWDLASGSRTATLTGHEDYVRCGAPNPTSPEVWATGSYDHTVRLWDTRQSGGAAGSAGGGAGLTVNHGDPVEAVLILPGGGLMMSAGGSTVKVWDVLAGGKLVHSWSNHQKTIMSLCLDGTGTRVMTASLDCNVKIHDLQSYQMTHGLKYTGPILSLGVGPDNCKVVTGLADGTLAVRQRVDKPDGGGGSGGGSKRAAGSLLSGASSGRRFFMRGRTARPAANDFVVDVRKKQRLRPHDALMKAFKYGAALDAALATKEPIVVISMLQELAQRGVLEIGLGGRDEAGLEPLLGFLVKYFSHPHYCSLLITVTEALLRLYAQTILESGIVGEQFVKLKRKIKTEVALQKDLARLMGCMEAVIAAANDDGGSSAAAAQ